jgi:hypothetical protein
MILDSFFFHRFSACVAIALIASAGSSFAEDLVTTKSEVFIGP